MVMFWKPTTWDDPRSWGAARTKHLGRGLYVLWCRCDLCFQSGPSHLFTLMERDDATGEMCGFCAAVPETMFDLLSDGWKIRER